MAKIKAVIFDIDNTLIDFFKMKELSVEDAIYAMIATGLKKSHDEIWDAIDKIYQKHGIEYQNVFNDVLKQFEGKVDNKKLGAAISAYRKVRVGHIMPYANVIPTLIALTKRGYKLGVISDAPSLQMWIRLCDMGLEHFFDFVIASEDEGELKPSPLPFKRAIEILKLKPEEIIMVGDNMHRDVAGAKNIGMVSVLAKYGQSVKRIVGIEPRNSIENAKPDYEINDVKELLEVLK
jgi:putative hydrolase of the HAD superfamily